jgi:hypothetical protein
MTRRRRLTAFLDALAAGRRPGQLDANADDVEIVRTAITLRAARPGDDAPDEAFVSDLFDALAEQAATSPRSNVRSFTMRRSRAVLASVAAGIALIGGTFAVTDLTQSPAVPSAAPVPRGTDVRTGTFEAKNGTVIGQIVAYRGHPSWVFMNIGVTEPTGTIMCKLQLNNGSIVSAGIIHVDDGTGQLSKAIPVDIGRLRGAKLLSTSGSVVASATLA